MFKRSTVFILCSVILMGTFAFSDAVRAANQQTTKVGLPVYYREDSYTAMLAQYGQSGKLSAESEPVKLSVPEIKSENDVISTAQNIGGLSDAVLDWADGSTPWIEWSFSLPESGLYSIRIKYLIPPDSPAHASRGFLTDGKTPFAEAESVIFPQMYTDKSAPGQNVFGDETVPGQTPVSGWRDACLEDSLGLYDEPYMFYFETGEHSFRLEYKEGAMYIAEVEIFPAYTPPSYKELAAEYARSGYTGEGGDFELEAEKVSLKTSPVIRMSNDADPTCTPRNDSNIVMNVINGLQFKNGNDRAVWNIDVPADGFYKISFRVKQAWGDGLPVFRRIELDGQAPFSELLQYKFKYHRGWYTETLSGENGDPFLFYLTRGPHELSLSVKMGSVRGILETVQGNMAILSEMLLNIKMITGNEPDLNYEYRLEKKIPGLIESINTVCADSRAVADYIAGFSEKTPPAANVFYQIAAIFDQIAEDPDIITRKLSEIEYALGNMGAWYSELQVQPLGLDRILFSAPGSVIKSEKASVFDYIKITFMNFLGSFTRDYNRIDKISEDKAGKAVLNIWIGRGKEWGEILKELAAEDFFAKYNTQSNINVLPASQVEAGTINTLLIKLASGQEPDIVLGVAANLPGEFAMRGVLCDLSEFSGFNEMKKRFIDGILIPFEYDGGCYALPETMNFKALVYRKDIIERLDISVPDTFEELYARTLPELYLNNLNFYYNSGDFATMLFQHGGDFYTEDKRYSALDTPEAFNAFSDWTDLFTNQGVPIMSNFYSRFRVGDMPMGICGYGEYITLTMAAPELTGRIGMAPIPGCADNGTVNRYTSGYTSTGAIIFKSSGFQKEAFEFLDWWMSDSVQMDYGYSLEAVIGRESRWNSANKNAFLQMPWNDSEKAVLTESFKWVKESPVVMGGYYTSRHLTNAWNRTVLNKADARDSLEKAVEDINRELRLRREERTGG